MKTPGKQIARGRAAYAAIASGPKTVRDVAQALADAGTCKSCDPLGAARLTLRRLVAKGRISYAEGVWRVSR